MRLWTQDRRNSFMQVKSHSQHSFKKEKVKDQEGSVLRVRSVRTSL